MSDSLVGLLKQITVLRAELLLCAYGITDGATCDMLAEHLILHANAEHLFVANKVTSYLTAIGMPVTLCDCCVDRDAPHEHFGMSDDVRALLILKYGTMSDMYRAVIPLALE